MILTILLKDVLCTGIRSLCLHVIDNVKHIPMSKSLLGVVTGSLLGVVTGSLLGDQTFRDLCFIVANRNYGL
jgi:hypothetical protein